MATKTFFKLHWPQYLLLLMFAYIGYGLIMIVRYGPNAPIDWFDWYALGGAIVVGGIVYSIMWYGHQKNAQKAVAREHDTERLLQLRQTRAAEWELWPERCYLQLPDGSFTTVNTSKRDQTEGLEHAEPEDGLLVFRQAVSYDEGFQLVMVWQSKAEA